MTVQNWIVFRRIAMFGALVLFLTVSAAIAMAPYLPRLLLEGFPQPRWPAPGSFAPLAGDSAAAPFGSLGEINAWSRQLLIKSGGKALLVHHAGRLQLAHYSIDTRPETRFNSYSMSKSLIGALVLKAIADGHIASLDDPIGRYLPAAGDADFRTVPLRAFITMRSGIAAEAGATKSMSGPELKDLEALRINPFGPMARLHMAGLQAVAGDLRSVASAQGTFNYQNINTALLGAVIARVYGKPLEAVLMDAVWLPAGAAPSQWRRYGDGLPVTPYCCIYATPSDWLRVGVYLMRNGTQDAPFLPDALWRQLFGTAIKPAERAAGRYGNHIYHNVLDRPGEPVQGPFTYMFGNRGQVVYMMHAQDLVVVRFGEGIQLLHSTLYAAWRSFQPKTGVKKIN